MGKTLGNGNGAHIDTLAPHVWGGGHESESRKVKSVRRGLLREAFDEIVNNLKHLHDDNSYGWVIDQSSAGIVFVSRPKKIPVLEKAAYGMTPGQLDAALKSPFNEFV